MNADAIPGMRSGRAKRNLLVAVLYLLLLPFILLGSLLYLSYAVAANRHGLGDRLAASPLGRIPTIANGGVQAGVTVFVLVVLVLSLLGLALPADSGSDVASDSSDTPTVADESNPSEEQSGSTGDTTPEDSTSTDADASDSDRSEDGTDGSTEEPTDGGDNSSADDDTVTVEVVDVVDGDTMDIEYDNGTEDTVRLLGVDTPETHTSVSPDEFERVPDSEAGRQCLRDYGDRASEFATDTLAGETVEIQFDAAADRRGVFDRLLVYILIDGENFNHRLLEDGYARVFDSQFSQSDRFYATESAAQENQTGVWECRNVNDGTSNDGSRDDDSSSSESSLTVAEIHEDAAGTERENLDDEYIVFQNDGDEPLDLTGWAVEDDSDFRYEFPTGFTLQPGAEVTLRTGQGSDTETDLYWGLERPVWNNSGDIVYVYNGSDTLVIEESYS